MSVIKEASRMQVVFQLKVKKTILNIQYTPCTYSRLSSITYLS